MELEYISLPLVQPAFQFAQEQALAAYLNHRETNFREVVQEVGCYTDGTGNFYGYQPLEVGEQPEPQRLVIKQVTGSWEQFTLQHIYTHALVTRALIVLAPGGSKVEVAVLRPLEHPLSEVSGTLATSAPGWEWLQPQIVGADLVLQGVTATWFGGPHDHQDPGGTASNMVNTKAHPEFEGCALPMNGFRNSANTMGSPLPRFRWGTLVEVTCREPDLDGRQLTVPLIDLGPARQTKHAADLTEAAFNRLGAASRRGAVRVDVRIPDWKQHLEPGAAYTEIPGSSSEQKPLLAGAQKDRAPLTVPAGFDLTGFRNFVASLRLTGFTADEFVPYFSEVRHGVANSAPEAALWANFVPTLLVLNALRARLGRAVLATSTYRHPRYNRQLDGAAGLSQHMAFRAADIQVSGLSPRAVHAELSALRGTVLSIPAGAQFQMAGMRNDGFGIDARTPFNRAGLQIVDPSAAHAGSFVFEGGLGLYETFVHVDCRGIHTDW